MRESIPYYYSKMAVLVSTRSTCLRRSVGCVLVDERKHVLSTGFNGAPSNVPNCCDTNICVAGDRKSGQNLDNCIAVHAEENALIQCKNVFSIESCFVTTFPCLRCLRMLMNTSCKHIIYLEPYGEDMDKKIDLWKSSNPDRSASSTTYCFRDTE